MNNFKILKLVSNIIYSHDVHKLHISYTSFAPPQLKFWLRHWVSHKGEGYTCCKAHKGANMRNLNMQS